QRSPAGAASDRVRLHGCLLGRALPRVLGARVPVRAAPAGVARGHRRRARLRDAAPRDRSAAGARAPPLAAPPRRRLAARAAPPAAGGDRRLRRLPPVEGGRRLRLLPCAGRVGPRDARAGTADGPLVVDRGGRPRRTRAAERPAARPAVLARGPGAPLERLPPRPAGPRRLADLGRVEARVARGRPVLARDARPRPLGALARVPAR